jgi:quinol-cytochrome oxidoreductase complex cytochrome b subunit
LAVFLCLILALTGMLEMFYYIPTSALAPVTVETIHYFVPLGSLVRNLHYWAGQLLVIVSTIHLLRVVFTGAYSRRRRFNFVLGMALFGLVLMIDFTGYVLRWDEGIRWALATGTNLLGTIPLVGPVVYRLAVGGSQVGPATLIRFYAWHIFVLSAGAAFLLVWHIFRLRRDGGMARRWWLHRLQIRPPRLRGLPSPRYPADSAQNIRRECWASVTSIILILRPHSPRASWPHRDIPL